MHGLGHQLPCGSEQPFAARNLNREHPEIVALDRRRRTIDEGWIDPEPSLVAPTGNPQPLRHWLYVDLRLAPHRPGHVRTVDGPDNRRYRGHEMHLQAARRNRVVKRESALIPRNPFERPDQHFKFFVIELVPP